MPDDDRRSKHDADSPTSPPAAPEATSPVLTRRRILFGGTAVAGAAAAGALGCLKPEEEPTAVAQEAISDVGDAVDRAVETLRREKRSFYRDPYLIEPQEIEARGTLLDMVMNIDEARARDPDTGSYIKVRAYSSPQAPDNPVLPGPTLRFKAGDQLKIKLSNNLPENPNTEDHPCPPTEDNGLYCINTTNFHTHGLHVSPKSPQDNVLLKIPPKGDNPEGNDHIFDFDFRIPSFHPGGTHWYHPHKHGSTDLQVRNGMSGALVIEDRPEETTPEIAAADDVVMVIQEISTDLEIAEEYKSIMELVPLQLPSEAMAALEKAEAARIAMSSGDKLAINGKADPIIKMRPGEVQRWRIINSAVSAGRGFVALKLIGSKLPAHVIAMDGLLLPEVWVLDGEEYAVLGPGNRADLMVKATGDETEFALWSVDFDRGGEDVPALRLARVEVSGPPVTPEQQLPTGKLPLQEFLQPITDDEVSKCRTVTFGPGLTVDGRPYSSKRVDQCMEMDTAEEWTLENMTGRSHPFHIHVNPFQIVSMEGFPYPTGPLPRWGDTINVPPTRNGGRVKYRSRFQNFDGMYVLHCHILRHEDDGMMQKVEVKPKGEKCTEGTSENPPNSGQACKLG